MNFNFFVLICFMLYLYSKGQDSEKKISDEITITKYFLDQKKSFPTNSIDLNKKKKNSSASLRKKSKKSKKSYVSLIKYIRSVFSNIMCFSKNIFDKKSAKIPSKTMRRCEIVSKSKIVLPNIPFNSTPISPPKLSESAFFVFEMENIIWGIDMYFPYQKRNRRSAESKTAAVLAKIITRLKHTKNKISSRKKIGSNINNNLITKIDSINQSLKKENFNTDKLHESLKLLKEKNKAIKIHNPAGNDKNIKLPELKKENILLKDNNTPMSSEKLLGSQLLQSEKKIISQQSIPPENNLTQNNIKEQQIEKEPLRNQKTLENKTIESGSIIEKKYKTPHENIAKISQVSEKNEIKDSITPTNIQKKQITSNNTIEKDNTSANTAIAGVIGLAVGYLLAKLQSKNNTKKTTSHSEKQLDEIKSCSNNSDSEVLTNLANDSLDNNKILNRSLKENQTSDIPIGKTDKTKPIIENNPENLILTNNVKKTDISDNRKIPIANTENKLDYSNNIGETKRSKTIYDTKIVDSQINSGKLKIVVPSSKEDDKKISETFNGPNDPNITE